jgi:hypothetical protein
MDDIITELGNIAALCLIVFTVIYIILTILSDRQPDESFLMPIHEEKKDV